MRSHFSKIGHYAVAVLTAVTATIVVAAAPAQARSWEYTNTYGYLFKCEANSKTFDLPNKTDVNMNYHLCLGRKGNTLAAKIITEQKPVDTIYTGSGHKWDGLEVVYHLERRLRGSSGPDHVVKTFTCNLKDSFNQFNWVYFQRCEMNNLEVFWWPGVAYDPAYEWSIDGVLHYDIDNDGLGWDYWDYTGTPLH